MVVAEALRRLEKSERKIRDLNLDRKKPDRSPTTRYVASDFL